MTCSTSSNPEPQNNMRALSTQLKPKERARSVAGFPETPPNPCQRPLNGSRRLKNAWWALWKLCKTPTPGKDGRFTDLVHRLSIDLDVFSGNLFTGLQRSAPFRGLGCRKGRAVNQFWITAQPILAAQGACYLLSLATRNS